MKMLTFLFFLFVTVYFIWTSKISYGKKTLAGTGKSFVGVFIVIILIGFLLKGMTELIPGFTRDAARDLMGKLGVSLIFIWGMRFMIVAMCNIFSAIMSFHKKYNADNYRRFSPITNKLTPGLFAFSKIVLSLGSVVIYYGIWLTN